MAKAKKADRTKEREILKCITKHTIFRIDNYLKDTPVDDIINNIFIVSDDEELNYLIKRFDSQLILSKVNNELFKRGLHKFYLDLAKYIKDNSLYKKLFKLNYLQNA